MPQEKLIAYVDGFNLYNGIHDQWRCSYLWLDVVALVRDLRPSSQLVAVNYFTAHVLNDADGLARQRNYVSALVANSGGLINVVMGRYQTKWKQCRKCGHSYRLYEEKETDVNIAVSLVSDAALGRMDAALLISADSDLAPAVRAAKIAAPNLFVAAAFPPKRYSAELAQLMPASFHIGNSKITGSQLPETVTGQAGDVFARPVKWGGSP